MNLFICDTETNGLEPPIQVVEVAWKLLREVGYNEFIVEQEFDSLVDIGDYEMNPEASAINGIRKEQLIGCPKLAELPWPTEEVIFVSHNVPFDRPLLASYLNIIDELCTLQMSRRLLPAAPRHKLDVLKEWLEFPQSVAHRAISDVDTATRLLFYMEEGYGEGMKGLLNYSKRPFTHKVMPWGKHAGKKFSEIPVGYMGWLNELELDRDMRLTVDKYFRSLR
jgi:DNA polymerase-3 subunit epsilon